MRFLIAMILCVALAGVASADAPELPPLPAVADVAPLPAAPDAPETPEAPPAPAVPDASGLTPAPIPGLEPPAGVPALAPAEVGEILPEPTAPGRAFPFQPGDIALPPPETVVATGAIAGGVALIGFALYSRLSKNEILDHERRDGVFQLVRAEPGISLTDVASRTGLGWGTVVYHLDRLERAGFVMSERNGGRRCYFPVGTVPKDARPSLGALQQETTRSVASFVAERPGATQTELAEALGLTASAASKQVSKLESVGLVRREREWKTVRLHPEPKLAQMLTPATALAA